MDRILEKSEDYGERMQTEVRKFFDIKGYVDESNLHKLKYLNSVTEETLRLHPPEVLSIRK